LPENPQDLLHVENLVTGYEKKQVINGVSLHVRVGEIVALIGHNGAGKSTLLKAIFGLLPIWKGKVTIGQLASLAKPQAMLRAGIVYVPQGNRVFSDLTVRENLEMSGISLPDKNRVNERIEHVFTIFPTLKARLSNKAGRLSGGEKQMLALANALILSPRLLMLDEPSLGLSPALVSEAFNLIKEVCEVHNVSILIVEQKVREVIKIAQRIVVLRNGIVSYDGPTSTLDDSRLCEVYL
jgi:branched-chain amino acid transport system ATP-binding protein